MAPGVIPAWGPFWQANGYLCAIDGAVLPPRCVKCNGTDRVTMVKKQYSWHPPWVYALIRAGLLIYIILALVLQKRVTVTFGVCAKHRAKRRNAILIGWLSFLQIFVLIGCAIAFDNGWLILIGFVLFVAGVIYGTVASPILKPGYMNDYKMARLKGACPEFIASLPPGPIL